MAPKNLYSNEAAGINRKVENILIWIKPLMMLHSDPSQILISESSEGLVHAQTAAPPPPEALDSGGLGWSPRICMSNRFPGHADNVRSGMTL